MEGSKLWEEYMDWMLRDLKFNKKGYYKLLLHLHLVPFEWSMVAPFDENRAMDGVYNRYYFFRDIGLKDGDFKNPCSVLEMLYSFAVRVGREWIGYDKSDMEDHFDRIFWLFLCNLGLDKYDDSSFDEENVNYILHRWLKREYKDDGRGSLFPLKEAKIGYKNLEIFKQMNIFMKQFNIKSTGDLE